MARAKLDYNVVIATFKLEKENFDRFNEFLNGVAKNKYLLNRIEWFMDFYNNANEVEKGRFIIALNAYSSRRKKFGDKNDKTASKTEVVSVRLKDTVHKKMIENINSLGFSNYSDFMRRLVLKDLTEAGY